MDYRVLLLKYINHVGRIEGTDFLGDFYSSVGFFTQEEWDEINKLGEESNLTEEELLDHIASRKDANQCT